MLLFSATIFALIGPKSIKRDIKKKALRGSVPDAQKKA